MAATMRKRGGKYVVTVHADGKRKQKTYSVKREAEQEMNRANVALKKGGTVIARTDTLNHFIERWFRLVIDNSYYAHGTRVRYHGIFEQKIRDGIGKMGIEELTRPFMIEHFEDLILAGHSRPDVEGRILVINGGLTKAVDTGHGTGPHPGLVKSLYPGRKKKKKKIDIFTVEEETRILENTKADFYPATLLLFQSGMRLGEVLGLDFNSINYIERFIVVRQSYRNGLLSGTKTGVERIVPFGDELFQVFQDLRVTRNEARLKGNDNESVFTRNGKRLDQGTFRYAWGRCLERCGLEYRKPHTTRHSVATRLLDAGNSTKLVAELLGHTVQTLLSTYSHESKNEEQKKRDMLLQLNAANQKKTRRDIVNS